MKDIFEVLNHVAIQPGEIPQAELNEAEKAEILAYIHNNQKKEALF